MPVPAMDALNLWKDYRSAEEHLKGSTRELQPLQPESQLHQGPILNASIQMHIALSINKRS